MSPLTEPTKLVLAKPTGASLRVAPIGRGGDLLYSQAGTPSLDLRFAEKKTLTDYVSGNNLVTFSRPVGANQSPGTYVDENGLIQLSSANTPRFDHDPTTGESLGLLVEEARTNLVAYSEQFDNAAGWLRLKTTVTSNATTAPDGLLSADKISHSTSVAEGVSMYRASAAYSAGSYTFSVYAKEDEARYFQILFSSALTTEYANFDLQAKTVTAGSYVNAKVEAVGFGFVRVSIVTNFAAASGSPFLSLIDSPTAGRGATFSGVVGDGIYLWGAQLEAGSFPTSYIPTAGTTVTRAADVASITGANFSSWYNQSEGSFRSRVAIDHVALSKDVIFSAEDASSPTSNHLISFIDDNGPNRAGIKIESANSVLVNGWIAGTQVSSSKPVAIAYSSGGVSLVNNQTLYSGNSVVPASINSVTLGSSSQTSFTPLNGHIARLAYWPQRLPDATLQTITT